jgi:hypothetical protein
VHEALVDIANATRNHEQCCRACRRALALKVPALQVFKVLSTPTLLCTVLRPGERSGLNHVTHLVSGVRAWF